MRTRADIERLVAPCYVSWSLLPKAFRVTRPLDGNLGKHAQIDFSPEMSMILSDDLLYECALTCLAMIYQQGAWAV